MHSLSLNKHIPLSFLQVKEYLVGNFLGLFCLRIILCHKENPIDVDELRKAIKLGMEISGKLTPSKGQI